MKSLGLIISTTLFALMAHAQVRGLENQTWDFGEVVYWKNDTAWFKITNNASHNLIFLPTYYNEEFRVILSNRAAEPGETITIGIIYYTEETGRFNVDIPLYVNLKPDAIHFYLKGKIKSFDPTAQLRCPVVNEGASPADMEKVVSLEVRDRQTEELLTPDQISVRTKSNRKVDLDKVGMEYKMSIIPGGYSVAVNKKGYDDYQAMIMLEPYQTRFIVYLDRQEEPEVHEPVAVVINIDSIAEMERRKDRDVQPTRDTTPIKAVPENPELHVHPDTIIRQDTIVHADTLMPKKDEGILSLEEYKLNNVILIVDVSSSMNRGGKLDDLKSSFDVLVDALRPEDKVAVITMSSDAKLIQAPTYVEHKDSLKERVHNMKAAGSTNGGAALQLAYQLAADHFVSGGNNQIIIATDGIFYGGNLTRKDMEKLIANGNAKGIHLSTVALGSDPKALMFLENLSHVGGGSFVHIMENEADSAQLLRMIKSQSRLNNGH